MCGGRCVILIVRARILPHRSPIVPHTTDELRRRSGAARAPCAPLALPDAYFTRAYPKRCETLPRYYYYYDSVTFARGRSPRTTQGSPADRCPAPRRTRDLFRRNAQWRARDKRFATGDPTGPRRREAHG